MAKRQGNWLLCRFYGREGWEGSSAIYTNTHCPKMLEPDPSQPIKPKTLGVWKHCTSYLRKVPQGRISWAQRTRRAALCAELSQRKDRKRQRRGDRLEPHHQVGRVRIELAPMAKALKVFSALSIWTAAGEGEQGGLGWSRVKGTAFVSHTQQRCW